MSAQPYIFLALFAFTIVGICIPILWLYEYIPNEINVDGTIVACTNFTQTCEYHYGITTYYVNSTTPIGCATDTECSPMQIYTDRKVLSGFGIAMFIIIMIFVVPFITVLLMRAYKIYCTKQPIENGVAEETELSSTV